MFIACVILLIEMYINTLQSSHIICSILLFAYLFLRIIIDLRCYPGDFMVYDFGELLVPKSTEFCKAAIADLQHPGTFLYTHPGAVGSFNPLYYKGKVIILVNENTQSQAEFTAMAFRIAPNAIVIGSTTAGADGDISIINLPGAISTMISGIAIMNPDKSNTQVVGISPDIEVITTIESIRSNEDIILQTAINCMLQNN